VPSTAAAPRGQQVSQSIDHVPGLIGTESGHADGPVGRRWSQIRIQRACRRRRSTALGEGHDTDDANMDAKDERQDVASMNGVVRLVRLDPIDAHVALGAIAGRDGSRPKESGAPNPFIDALTCRVRSHGRPFSGQA